MNRILSIYFTAGYPELHSTTEILLNLQQEGADIVEIGIPFSDPLADGPTIQSSSEIALKNGMTLRLLFNQLKEIKSQLRIPVILMGYLNSVMQFGVEEFCKACKETGVKGVILPDLPIKEYLEEYKSIFEKYELKNIFLVTPQTSEERIRLIDGISDWFIYAVSSNSITGNKLESSEITTQYFEKLKSLKLKNPILIGFGIKDKSSFDQVCNYAGGAIIGSEFIRQISGKTDLKNSISEFIAAIKPNKVHSDI